MTIDGLQSVLARMEAIQSRIEGLNPDSASTPEATANVFGQVLNNAIQGQQEDRESDESPALRLQPNVQFDQLIQQQSQTAQVDPDLVKAVIRQESGFNPKAVSHVGAQGLMQLMPSTASGLGVTDSFNPAQNVAGGAKYLKNLLNKYDQSVPMALAAYNAGPGAVDKYHGVPPYKETQNYVKNVMKSYRTYQNQAEN
jgi:soluble lytic murein transglycosylase-like protein